MSQKIPKSDELTPIDFRCFFSNILWQPLRNFADNFICTDNGILRPFIFEKCVVSLSGISYYSFDV